MYLLCSFYQILVEKTCSDIFVSSISTLAPNHCKNREKLTKLACIDNYSRYNFSESVASRTGSNMFNLLGFQNKQQYSLEDF